MVFIRRKKVKGRVYFQLVENVFVNGKRKQKVINHLGNEDSAKDYCRQNNLPFEVKEYQAEPSVYFGSSRQSSEFMTALNGRSEIPLKFEYLKDGSKKWDSLVKSKDYDLGFTESQLIKKYAPEVFLEIKNKVNLLDLGCGNGDKSIIFLNKIKYKRKYIGLDISKSMLDLASQNISKKFPFINLETHKIDFEEGNFAHITESLREKNYSTNFILFLGNTLGNVSDKSRVLSNIRESMTLNDYLLIGIELFDIKKTQNILNHYKGNRIWQDNIFNSLEYFGLKQSDGFFEVLFNKNKDQVEARFVLNKDKELKCGSRKIKLKKKNKILLMVSYKANPTSIQILLAETGFIIKRIFFNENEDYALILCKPSKL